MDRRISTCDEDKKMITTNFVFLKGFCVLILMAGDNPVFAILMSGVN